MVIYVVVTSSCGKVWQLWTLNVELQCILLCIVKGSYTLTVVLVQGVFPRMGSCYRSTHTGAIMIMCHHYWAFQVDTIELYSLSLLYGYI